MPKPPSEMQTIAPPAAEQNGQELPPATKAFTHHKVDLTWKGGTQAHAECPFCGREDNKFSVNVLTGLFGCKVCGVDGNPLEFLNQLWKFSDKATSTQQLAVLAQDRKLCDPMTLNHWGACKSILTGEWLVPAYAHHKDKEGGLHLKLHQLYRYVNMLDAKSGKWHMRLIPTPGVWGDGKVHGVFMPSQQHDPDRGNILTAEGAWDGMALWEVLQQTEHAHDTNVVAVPGANVFSAEWQPFFTGKSVTLLFDNDHPRKNPATGDMNEPAGFAGVKRCCRVLAAMSEGPSSVNWLRWGEQGFDPQLPDGHDVRDWLADLHPARLSKEDN